MTAETLKPFITPTSAEHFPATHTPLRRQHHSNLAAIGLSVTCIVLATILVGVTIWHSVRVSNLEREVKTLNRVVESMRVRLGLNYLDDMEDFEKEYSKVFIDIPNNSTNSDGEDIDDDDDDDEDQLEPDIIDDDEDDDFYPGEYTDLVENYDDLDAMVKKYTSYDSADDDDENDNTDEDRNSSDDDNLYDDFEKFKDSKKKQGSSSRKTRAISNIANGLPLFENSYLAHRNKTDSNDLKKDGNALTTEQQTATRKPLMRPQPMSFDHLHNNKLTHKRQFVSDKLELRQRSPLRPRGQRRRKIPIMKSGDSLISAKSTVATQQISFLPAAHFHLNRKVPDRYAAIKVDSYPGDMYIGTPSSSHEPAFERYFKVENGVLTVREPGLYYIYAQVCYNNTHDQNGFVIFHGHRPFLQCLNTVPTNMPLKIHTCHTSGLIHLRANETLHLRDFHSDRNAILKDTNNRSYFGLIKV